MGRKKINYSDILGAKPRVQPAINTLLGNIMPFIRNDNFIFANSNRVYCFLSTSPINTSSTKSTLYTNYEISFYNFILGLYIQEVLDNKISYDKDFIIHKDKSINKFIHNILSRDFTLEDSDINYIPSLNLTISNGNAVQPLVTYNNPISILTYAVIIILHYLEADPGLYYGNNGYATIIPLNIKLALSHLSIPIENLWNLFCSKFSL
ncbi:hypothetical protein [Clostridium fallax]|uniref:Uncharacterized protein n=1 Tax=Clostridium fallax TaxID=1533 RepID=A0A1M4TFM2_9CLOT|nr:hypothetical protein [Clostridium fallax]SHE43302.1 hypothetical protein SAMN05443638_102173 [Clostridium fallax]SQB22739.1 Uncharacterised protein [Clostridium fallax]